MKTVIMVLGAPNDEYGNLSAIALDRLYLAYELAINNEKSLLLCTGGNGDHFNKTEKPHYYFAERFLQMKGIDKGRFLNGIPSRNTIEDFTLSMPTVQAINPDLLVIVTSKFHMGRVRYIAEKVFGSINKFYVSSTSSLTETELKPLIDHENQALQAIKEKGLNFN